MKIINGGIFRLKHHLAGTKFEVHPCLSAPDDVSKTFLELLDINSEVKETKRAMVSTRSLLQQQHSTSGSGSIFASSGSDSSRHPSGPVQTTLSRLHKKELRREACQSISHWFYKTATSFNATRDEEYDRMFELAARHGPGFKPPSYHEVRGTFLKEKIKEIDERLTHFRVEWKNVGCTIMSDGWTDRKRRSICNFLVNSPKGTIFIESLDTSDYSKTVEKVFQMLDKVVEKVGEENVVQVVTDNASAYKAAGKKLMEKRKHLFWTPCAAHCLDLMLEDFDKKLKVHKETVAKGKKITNYIYGRAMLISMLREITKGADLIRPGATRFATSYLTLGCLSEHKGNLMTMFSSDAWKKSSQAKEDLGKRVQAIVLDGRFWTNVNICIRAALPVVKVLHLADSEGSPSMPFLYMELNAAMEKIKRNFNNNEQRYKPIVEIIENRWQNQMKRPLHLAAYWLNPKVHYGPEFDGSAIARESKQATFQCVQILVRDDEEKLQIMEQLDHFHYARGMFSAYGAMQLLDRKHPADWWSSFGDDVPQLQKFAIRILSLTTSASGCERNWSDFEQVHSKRRNKLMQKKMNDLVYVKYNSKLIDAQFKKKERDFDDVESDNEWIAEDIEEGDNVNHTDVDVDEPTFEGGTGQGQDIQDEYAGYGLGDTLGDDLEDDHGDGDGDGDGDGVGIGDEEAHGGGGGYGDGDDDLDLDVNVDPADLM